MGGVDYMTTCRDDQLYVIGIEEKRIDKSQVHLQFRTTHGTFEAIYQPSPGSSNAVVFLSGIQGGFDGPGSLYTELVDELLSQGVASLMLSCRIPDDCCQCSIDTLLALQYLDDEAIRNVILVGWSFGGAVALSAGALAKNVCGIAAISTLAISPNCSKRLLSKPILLLHGEADAVCSVQIPRRIHDEAIGPRHLIVYANAGHTLEEVKGQLHQDLQKWISTTFKEECEQRLGKS